MFLHALELIEKCKSARKKMIILTIVCFLGVLLTGNKKSYQ
jgi:hypothetical protein